MRDQASSLDTAVSIASILGNNTTEGTGTGVDLKGYESATVVFNFGISGDTLSGSVYVTPTVEESDDNSTWSTATDLVDSGLSVIDDAAEDPALQQVGYVGTKRYIRALITFTGSHTNGMPISACVVRGRGRHIGGDAV